MTRTPPAGARPAAKPRSGEIYAALRARICTTRVAPGELLHEERLAEEFSVSRSPVRWALAKLEHDGLVEIRHGVGTRVTTIDRDELSEVYELRMILATQSGPYLETPFEAVFIDRLRGWRRDFAALAPGDVRGFADVNMGYYTDLTARTRNRYLREMQLGLFFQTSRMWLITLPRLQWDAIVAAIVGEIDELVRVAEDQDPTGFGLVMRNHIFMSRRRLYDADGADGAARP